MSSSHFWLENLLTGINFGPMIEILSVLTEDINILFRIYPLREIKKVWAETMAIQDNRYKDINRFIAGCYFGVKHPDSYVKRVKTHELNKRYL